MKNKPPRSFKVKIDATTLKKDLRKKLIYEIAGATKTDFVFDPPIACIDNDSIHEPLFYINSIYRDHKNSPIQIESSNYNKSFDLLLCSTEDLMRIHYRIMKICKKF